jgi:hypothetical protein
MARSRARKLRSGLLSGKVCSQISLAAQRGVWKLARTRLSISEYHACPVLVFPRKMFLRRLLIDFRLVTGKDERDKKESRRSIKSFEDPFPSVSGGDRLSWLRTKRILSFFLFPGICILRAGRPSFGLELGAFDSCQGQSPALSHPSILLHCGWPRGRAHQASSKTTCEAW